MKDLVDFSKDYSGKSTLHYVDTNAGAVMQKHTTLQLDGNAQNVATTDMATYNDGFTISEIINGEKHYLGPLRNQMKREPKRLLVKFFRSFTTEVIKNLIGMLSHFIS